MAAEQGGADANEVLAFVGVFGDFKGDGFGAGYDFRGGQRMADALISWPDQVRWSGNRSYWSMIDRVLWSNSLIEPCSACGRNVVSKSVSRAA